jgi:hypothetical protein
MSGTEEKEKKSGEANGQTSNISNDQKPNKPIGWKYSLFVSEIPPGENSEKVNGGKSNKPPGPKYSLFVVEKDPTPSQFKPNKAWKMPVQRSGALETTFAVSRGVQIISLIAIIGMSANFIAEMVNTNQSPPHVLIGTLTVVRSSRPLTHGSTNSIIDMRRSSLLCYYHHPLLRLQVP